MGKRLVKAGVVAVLLSLMSACTPPEPKPKPESAPEPEPVVMTAPPEPDPLEQRGKRLAKQLLDSDVAKRVAAAGELGLMAEAGELTEHELIEPPAFDEVYEMLRKVGADRPCESCGSTRWTIPAEGEKCTTIAMIVGPPMFDLKTAMFIPLICTNCGNVTVQTARECAVCRAHFKN